MVQGTREALRVALIDDHPIFRMGLRATLEREPGIDVVFETGSPLEAVELASVHQLDAAIVDVILPEMTGTQLTIALRRIQAHLRILGLSMIDEPLRVAELLRAGAAGFAHKTETPEAIITAVYGVTGGIRYLPPVMQSKDIERLLLDHEAWPLDRLTCREREVFDLMVEGFSNDEIAGRLFIARRTVETHRHHVMHKLAARSVVDLVRIALRYGMAVA